MGCGVVRAFQVDGAVLGHGAHPRRVDVDGLAGGQGPLQFGFGLEIMLGIYLDSFLR